MEVRCPRCQEMKETSEYDFDSIPKNFCCKECRKIISVGSVVQVSCYDTYPHESFVGIITRVSYTLVWVESCENNQHDFWYRFDRCKAAGYGSQIDKQTDSCTVAGIGGSLSTAKTGSDTY